MHRPLVLFRKRARKYMDDCVDTFVCIGIEYLSQVLIRRTQKHEVGPHAEREVVTISL
jgi:hypothetical protein